MLYDLWMKENKDTHLYAIEHSEKLVKRCKEIAKACDFGRSTFVAKSILEACEAPEVPEQLDAVMALHACDTATDEAIAFALKKNAKFIALVPCCQAEVARLLGEFKTKSEIQQLWRHNLHRREFGSQLTNVLRCLFLESHGYKVRVTELIGWEHSMKNELIIAERVQKSNGLAKMQLEKLLEEFPLKMKLWDLVSTSA
jgi:hypothetical protein